MFHLCYISDHYGAIFVCPGCHDKSMFSACGPLYFMCDSSTRAVRILVGDLNKVPYWISLIVKVRSPIAMSDNKVVDKRRTQCCDAFSMYSDMLSQSLRIRV